MKILVSGGLGFVGRNLARHFAAQGHTVTALGKESLNIGDLRSVTAAIEMHRPDVLCNCAGDKNLARCEEDGERAMRLNAYAPEMMAGVCRDKGVKFVTIGSDHAHSTPVTAYGESKRMMEGMVIAANPQSLIAVTGHVYAPDCPWLRWLDGELRKGEPVLAWADLRNHPTYAPNLAAMILDLLDRSQRGIWNCVGGQEVNRRELFQWYAVAAGLDAGLVEAAPYECPSLLHPRYIPTRRTYNGKVRRMTVAEGMQAMCREQSAGKAVAA